MNSGGKSHKFNYFSHLCQALAIEKGLYLINYLFAKDLRSTHRLAVHFMRSDHCCSNICLGRCVNSQQLQFQDQ